MVGVNQTSDQGDDAVAVVVEVIAEGDVEERPQATTLVRLAP
jgi:hypothetical protein